MRSSKINYAIVGLFVLSCIIGLVVTVAMLSGRTGATDTYHAIYGNVTGVQFGTQVVYEGYPIGQVIGVTPEPRDGRMAFRVDFDVLEGWRIPEDSEVDIAAPGLLAAVTLAIRAGDSATPLKPGSQIISRERADIFAVVSDLAGQFSELTDKYVKPLILNVDQAVTAMNEFLELRYDGQVIVADSRQAIADARAVIAEISARVPSVTAKVDGLLGNLESTSGRINEIVSPTNQKKLVAMIDNLNAASQKFDGVLVTTNSMLADIDDLVTDDNGDVRKSIADTRYIVESIARNIDAINQNMDGAARNLYEFTRQIRQNPGLLLGSGAPDAKEER